MKAEGGGERDRGADRRFDERVAFEEDEVGREESDSESLRGEVATFVIEGGEIVGLEGFHPTGESERQPAAELVDEEDDRLREKLAKDNILVIMLRRLGVLGGDFVMMKRERGLCRLLLSFGVKPKG